MEIFRELAPSIPINVSTQANVISLEGAKFWQKAVGAKRVILGREINKEQLKYIMDNKPKNTPT